MSNKECYRSDRTEENIGANGVKVGLFLCHNFRTNSNGGCCSRENWPALCEKGD